MLLASWVLVYFFKRFRSLNAENLGSVGQRAAKLLAIKLWEWLDRDRESNPGRLADWGRGRLADFFLRPPTLTASNFAALWPADPKFLALKDLNLLKKYTKYQEASSILRVVFALSKWPHLHRAYLVTICYRSFIAVSILLRFAVLLAHYNQLRTTGKLCKDVRFEFSLFSELLIPNYPLLFEFQAFSRSFHAERMDEIQTLLRNLLKNLLDSNFIIFNQERWGTSAKLLHYMYVRVCRIA